MGFLRGVGSALRVMADQFDPGRPRDMSDPRYWADAGRLSVAGVSVTERAVSQLGSVQAVRAGLSGSISSLPFMVFKRSPDGVHTEAREHPAYKLLSGKPDGYNTSSVFMGEIAWHLGFARNAFCRVWPGTDSAVGSLELIHYRRLARIERRNDGYVYYTFNPAPQSGSAAPGASFTLREDEVWHTRGNPLRECGLLGEGIWDSAHEVFGRAIAVHQYGNIWFANSGHSGGTLEHPGNFKDKADRDTFLENWREAGTGRNRHKDRLLTHGVKYNPIKVTNAEAQLLETEERSDSEVFGLWSYPPHRAARLARSTNNNIEQQSLDYVLYTLAPIAIGIQQSIEQDLFVGDDADQYFCEFNFEPLLRGDMLSMYRALLIARQGEWMSPNDVLRYLGRNPRTDAGGDEYKNPMTKNSGEDGQGAERQTDDNRDDKNPGN